MLKPVAKVVEQYFYATYHGDADGIRNVFHKDATINGFLDDKFYSWSVEAFIKNIVDRPIVAKNNEKYNKRIFAIDVTGPIAMIKAHNLVADVEFTDQISLALLSGQWKIINKLFTAS